MIFFKLLAIWSIAVCLLTFANIYILTMLGKIDCEYDALRIAIVAITIIMLPGIIANTLGYFKKKTIDEGGKINK